MKKKIRIAAITMCMSLMLAACGGANEAKPTEGQTEQTQSEETTKAEDAKVAGESDTVEAEEVTEEGMTPVSVSDVKDGTYEVEVNSSSSMFKIAACTLTVADGKMTADMRSSGCGTAITSLSTLTRLLPSMQRSFTGNSRVTIPLQ